MAAPNYGAIGESLTSIYDIGTGISQEHKANQLKKGLVRPLYTPPSAAQMALENAKIMALRQQFPGQNAAQGQIQSSTASAVRSAQEGASGSADLLNAASGINGNAQNANVALGVQAGQFQQQNQLGLNQALMAFAPYQDQQFAYNKDQPYQNTATAIKSLSEAGKTNIRTGIDEAGKSAMSFVGVGGLNGTGTPG